MSIFANIQPIRYRRSRHRERVRLPRLRQGPPGARQAHGGLAAPRRLLLALLQFGRRRHVRQRHPAAPLAGCGDRPRRWRGRSSRPPSTSCRGSALPYFTFHDADVMATAHDLRDARAATCATSKRRSPTKMAATGVKLLWGTANLFSHPALRGRRRHQPRPRGLRLCRRAGALLPRGHPSAGRRELRALGRPRRLRHPAQHRHEARSSTSWAASSRWWSSTSTRSASRAPS